MPVWINRDDTNEKGLKKEIRDSIKRVEKCLESSLSNGNNGQQTIGRDPRDLFCSMIFKEFQIFSKEPEQDLKTVNILIKNKQILTVEIEQADKKYLPFNMQEIESNPQQYLLSFTPFCKIYRTVLPNDTIAP